MKPKVIPIHQRELYEEAIWYEFLLNETPVCDLTDCIGIIQVLASFLLSLNGILHYDKFFLTI